MSNNTHYYESLSRLAYPKTFQSWIESEPVSEFFSAYCDSVTENEDYITEVFQSVFDVQTVSYTLRELIAASPLTMQNQLNPSRIADIWKNNSTGLNVTGQLLQMPRVIVTPDGENIMLFGGNHRIASLVLPFVVQGRYEGEDLEGLLNQSIKVLQYQIDFDAVSDLMMIVEEDNTEVRPTQDQMVEYANAIIVKLWESDNQSRTMKASEVSGAKLFEKGINRNDPDAVLSAYYRKGAKLVSQNDAAVWIAKAHIESNQDLEDMTDEDGSLSSNPDLLSKWFELPKFGTQTGVKITSFSSIIKAFFTALNKDTVTTTTSTGKEKKIKVWSKDLKSADCFTRIIDSITSGESPLLMQAIDDVFASAEGDYAHNLTKQATAIGQRLYELMSEDLQPEYDVLEQAPQAAPKHTHKLSMSLGL